MTNKIKKRAPGKAKKAGRVVIKVGRKVKPVKKTKKKALIKKAVKKEVIGKLLKSAVLRTTVLLLIVMFNWSGIFAVGKTISSFNDTENATENLLQSGILDFSLNAGEWQPEEEEVSLSPGDFVTRNVDVVNNSGALSFQYKVNSVKTAGDDGFCGVLSLKATLDDVLMYEGSLMNFVISSTVFSADVDNWSFEVGLPGSSSEFDSKSCEFKFVFSGWQDNLAEGDGFSDVEELENIIESGSLSIGNFSPITDSYVDQTQRDKNYGNSHELQVRSKIGSGANKRTFIAFDFHFPENTTIISSFLKLYMKSAPPVSRDYEMRRVLSSWEERNPGGINWDNQSLVADTITDTVSTGETMPHWLSWNVASDMQSFVSGVYPNYGWRINDSVEESLNSRQGKFHSRESNTENKRPVLEITFNTPAATTTYPVINEVYYHVGSGKGSDPKNEWVEIYNPTNNPVDVSGWKICDNSACDTIPLLSLIPSKGFVVITGDASTWDKWPDIPATAIKITLNSYIGGGLANGGDSLILKDNTDVVIDAISYGSDISQLDPPINFSGKGKSLARIVKGYDTDLASDWITNAYSNPGINPSENGTEIIRFNYEGVEMAASEENLTPLSNEEWFEEDTEESVEAPVEIIEIKKESQEDPVITGGGINVINEEVATSTDVELVSEPEPKQEATEKTETTGGIEPIIIEEETQIIEENLATEEDTPIKEESELIAGEQLVRIEEIVLEPVSTPELEPGPELAPENNNENSE